MKLTNVIISHQARKFGEKHLCYKLLQWKKNCTFDILNNISEYATLVQLMYSLGYANRAVSMIGNCIIDSN